MSKVLCDASPNLAASLPCSRAALARSPLVKNCRVLADTLCLPILVANDATDGKELEKRKLYKAILNAQIYKRLCYRKRNAFKNCVCSRLYILVCTPFF